MHLVDLDKMLPTAAAQSVEARLAGFEHTSGIKILVQFHAKPPVADEDKVPGAYMHALAAQLGVDLRGVLVVYFTDDPDWRVWIGDELTSRFAGKPGTVKELTDSGAIHAVKETMLAAAQQQADASFQNSTTPTPAQRLSRHIGALVDSLTGRLKP